MLFDLKGKRRRAVQGTYLTLAILMGAGLVLFGVGSSVNGGLSDLFSGGGGGGSNNANAALQKRIDSANRQLQVNPRNEAMLKLLVKLHYQAAQAYSTSNNVMTAKGKAQLSQAASAWQRYLAQTSKPDASLASFMVQAYGPGGLGDAAKATRAAEIVADNQQTWQSYVGVVAYASLAHDKRTVDLASKRALALTSPGERGTVKQQIDQAKSAGAAQASQAGTAGAP